MGSEQGPGTDGLGQQQSVSGPQAALAHDVIRINQPVDRKAQCQLAAFAGMAADQRAAGFIQHFHGAGHHLVNHVFHLGLYAIGHGRNGGSTLSFGAHGKHVAQGVIGGNPAEHIGVVNKGAKEIDGVNHRLSGWDGQYGGVVWGV